MIVLLQLYVSFVVWERIRGEIVMKKKLYITRSFYIVIPRQYKGVAVAVVVVVVVALILLLE